MVDRSRPGSDPGQLPHDADTGAVAAIDLGTQTALLLVARRRADGGLDALEDHAIAARLGEGLAATGLLQEAAAERALEVLETFARRIALHGVSTSRVRAVGTAVLRRAGNAAAFVERVRERTGLAVEVLPEADEARLGWVAAVGDGAPAETLVVDVGGGSTEVVAAAGGERLSAPVGAVLLTETFVGRDGAAPLEPGGFEALVAAAREAVAAFPEGAARGRGEVVLLGGTASNLACLAQGLEGFDARLAEGARVDPAVVLPLARALAALSPEARLDRPIEPSRAEILPAGLACLGAALERIGAEAARVTGRGLRYGVARELAGI